MSENSDAVVVIVSEETGAISVAIGGMLKRRLEPETLRRMLEQELLTDSRKTNVIDRIKNIRKKETNDDNEA